MPYIRRPFTFTCMIPNFLIIGAQKAGTTSLFRYMLQHPDILKPLVNRELHYFDLHYHRGPNWYRAHFPFQRKEKITGEKSPYYIFHPLVPERCHAFNSDFRLILLLRDPVKRAYSHFHHEIENGRENRSFRQAVEEEMGDVENDHLRLARSEIDYSATHQYYSYFARGRYVEQLDLWTKFFARDQIYLETAERFFKESRGVCSEIFDFLGLKPFQTFTGRRHNPGKYNPLPEAEKRWLADLFRDSNQKLSEAYGVDISDWL
ncbi:MAG: sulfotransferase domain-containing protein [Desulfobacteraceae bacterium]|nr:sulfotransferase domain-containing protein [Desulfobacteraceae bacterium]